MGIRKVGGRHGSKEELYVPGILEGLGATVRHFFRNVLAPPEKKYIRTIQYPDVKVEYPHRFRGMHRLVPREDGTPRCVACFMCQTACPARCIHIVAGETDDERIEKFPVIFEIDELRCVVCGLCVEACPCDAIRMDTGIHPKPVFQRKDADFGKADLLAILGREETQAGERSNVAPPPSAAGTGRVDRAEGDRGAGGRTGGY
ncbi:MAG: NADH-quinone oxidoreductase subunit I [Myxococcales bacterium]|nr:NADH-quinone oxidoreductase subunit I [Myxococcales bacterium]